MTTLPPSPHIHTKPRGIQTHSCSGPTLAWPSAPCDIAPHSCGEAHHGVAHHSLHGASNTPIQDTTRCPGLCQHACCRAPAPCQQSHQLIPVSTIHSDWLTAKTRSGDHAVAPIHESKDSLPHWVELRPHTLLHVQRGHLALPANQLPTHTQYLSPHTTFLPQRNR